MSDDVKVTISADDKPLKEAFDRATKHVNAFGNNASAAINKANGYVGTMSNLFAGGVSPSLQKAGVDIEGTKARLDMLSESASRSNGGFGLFNGLLEASSSKMQMFSAAAIGVSVGMFAFDQLGKAVNFIKQSVFDSIDAFAEQEDALNKLAQSLNITGSFSDSAVSSIENFASQLEKTSRFSDDAIIRQIAFARSLGMSTAQAQNLVTAAANLSATLGGSLEENTEKLGRSFSGSLAKGLDKLIPGLKSLSEEQLRSGAAADYVNNKFNGAASNDLKTYSGSIQALGNSFNNLQETIGEAIVKSDIYKSILSTAKSAVDGFNSSVKTMGIATGLASGDYGILSKTASQLTNDIRTLDERTKALRDNLKTEQKDRSFWDQMTGGAAASSVQIEILTQARARLQAQLDSGKTVPEKPEDASPAVEEDVGVLDTRRKLYADLAAIKAEASLIEETTNRANNDARNAAFVEDEFARNQAEIARAMDFEKAKAEIVAIQKEESLGASIEGKNRELEIEKISQEKSLAQKLASTKASMALTANQVKEDKRLKDETIKFDIARYGYQAQQAQAAAGLANAVLKDGSFAQFAIAKGFAVAQILLARSTAMAQSLLLTPNIAAIAAMQANANIVAGLSLATVAATSLKFEQGGVVPGLNQFGDNVQIRVNPGEMILNNTQQKELLNVANGRSNSNDNGALASLVDAIRNQVNVIQIDGREIARVVRDQRASGFAI